MAILPKIAGVAGNLAKGLLASSGKAIARNTLGNMGTLGSVISDQVSKHQERKEEKKKESSKGKETKTKKVQKKKDGNTKDVTDALTITTETATNAFAFVGKEIGEFSDKVSDSLDGLFNYLNRIAPQKASAIPVAGSILSQNENGKDSTDKSFFQKILDSVSAIKNFATMLGGGGVAGWLGKKLLPKGISKVLAPLEGLGFKSLGKFALKGLGPLVAAGTLGYNLHTAGSGSALSEYLDSAMSGAMLGGAVGTAIGGVGAIPGALLGGLGGVVLQFFARNYKSEGNMSTFELEKLLFEAEDLVFKALDSIEFKKRLYTGNTLSDALGGAPVGKAMGAGFTDSGQYFNNRVNAENAAEANAQDKADAIQLSKQKSVGFTDSADYYWNDKTKKSNDKGGAVSVQPLDQTKGAKLTGEAVTDLISKIGLDENQNKTTIQGWMAKQGIHIDPSRTAWCAAAVTTELREKGIKTPKNYLAAGSYRRWGKEVDGDSVQKGDVLVNNKFSTRTGQLGSHVGMATGKVKRDESGHITSVEMISGNHKNKIGTNWVSIGQGSDQYIARRATEAIVPQDQTPPPAPPQPTPIQPEQPKPVLTPPAPPAPPESPEPAADNSPASPARSKSQKMSAYEGTMDQRNGKHVYDTDTFASYMGTVNQQEAFA